MSFEDDFPSLDKCMFITDRDMGNTTIGYSEEDIEKHCLDKQKVKSAIEKCTDSIFRETLNSCENIPSIDPDALKKELGL